MAPSSASRKGPLTHSDSQEGSRVKNFKLGEVLGKGSAGTVYKSLNMDTGDVVAIKQVPLRNIPKGDIGQIMREIHLLNHLDHNNIVKYMDSVKTKDHLNIVLEFVENGSLANTVKRFGSLPESLIAIYVEQVPYFRRIPSHPIPPHPNPNPSPPLTPPSPLLETMAPLPSPHLLPTFPPPKFRLLPCTSLPL
jgi:hypothetical protein